MEEPSIPVDSSEDRSATPLVSEEQPMWANSSEERSVTSLESREQLISAVAAEVPGRNLKLVEAARSGRLEDSRTLSTLSEENVALGNLPDKSSGSLSRDADGSCDSFSSASSVNSTESGAKRGRKSIKPSHYRTRRSTRLLLTSDVTD